MAFGLLALFSSCQTGLSSVEQAVVPGERYGFAHPVKVLAPPLTQDDLNPLPVVYILASSVQSSDLGSFGNWIERGLLPPFLTVIIDSSYTLPAGRSEEEGLWIFADFVGRSLVPWVESRYPVIGKAKGRILVGEGLLAGRIMSRFPRLFGGGLWHGKMPTPGDIPGLGEVPLRLWILGDLALDSDLQEYLELNESIKVNPPGTSVFTFLWSK